MDWQGPRQTATQAADRGDPLVSPVGLLWDCDWEAGNRTEPPIDDGGGEADRRNCGERLWCLGVFPPKVLRIVALGFQTRLHPRLGRVICQHQL